MSVLTSPINKYTVDGCRYGYYILKRLCIFWYTPIVFRKYIEDSDGNRRLTAIENVVFTGQNSRDTADIIVDRLLRGYSTITDVTYLPNGDRRIKVGKPLTIYRA
jgi:hypothetical protein